MSTAGGGFALLWLIVLALGFAVRIAFECWYRRRHGFWDWWYTEINRDPKAGQWYYGTLEVRRQRLRE